MEEFIEGDLLSYDAITDSHGDPLFESMTSWPPSIMDIVNDELELAYYVAGDVPEGLRKAGRATVKAFGADRRFVHLEFFQLDRDREGLGRKGDYVGLEVNMRPPGGYTPDMMNFAHSTDVYQIWADMVAFGERRKGFGEQYFCAYASRRDNRNYAHTHQEILNKYGSALCLCERVPAVLADALSDYAYIARFSFQEEIEPFFRFITE